jgi:hypothetical protein
MAGLVPAIHVFAGTKKAWITGTRPVMTTLGKVVTPIRKLGPLNAWHADCPTPVDAPDARQCGQSDGRAESQEAFMQIAGLGGFSPPPAPIVPPEQDQSSGQNVPGAAGNARSAQVISNPTAYTLSADNLAALLRLQESTATPGTTVVAPTASFTLLAAAAAATD